MNKKVVRFIKSNLKFLHNYVNYIANLNNKYYKAFYELCKKHNVLPENVKKSNTILKFEEDIKKSYNNAKSLYNDLKYIVERAKSSGLECVKYDIKSFNTRLMMIKFRKYKPFKLVLTKEYKEQQGTMTGGAAVLQNVQDMYTRNINHEKEGLDNMVNTVQQVPNAINDFIKNYKDMKEANTIGADKYFHAKANAEASQKGLLGKLTASAISNLREITDTFKNTLFKGMTLEESLKDSKEDLEANKFGRIQGQRYPYKDSKELVDKYRPNGLPQKY